VKKDKKLNKKLIGEISKNEKNKKILSLFIIKDKWMGRNKNWIIIDLVAGGVI